ncbi:hypothetical protein Tco_0294940 [Tanacetum coccineum]
MSEEDVSKSALSGRYVGEGYLSDESDGKSCMARDKGSHDCFMVAFIVCRTDTYLLRYSLVAHVVGARWPPWFKVAGRGRCSCSLLAMMIIFCVSFRQGALCGFSSLWKGGHRGLRLLSWTMFVFTLRLFFPRIAFPDRLLLLGLASADVPFGLP